MGGSSSNGGNRPTPQDPCNTLSFHSAINSPQPALIPKLKVGTILDVRLQTTPRAQIVVELKKQVVGALTGAKVSRLVSCIQNGYKYEAKVLSISGGNCSVKVQPA